MSLEWNGDTVKRKMIEAAKWGVDKTTSECVIEAKNRVPRVTSTLQGSIQMRPAKQQGDDVVGIWGSFDVDYAIYVEMGTSRMSGTPYLRPSADSQYPRLSDRIKRKFAELTN